MYKCIRNFEFEGETYRAGVTHIADDHRALLEHADNFREIDAAHEARARSLARSGRTETGNGAPPTSRTSTSDGSIAGQARDEALRAIEARSAALGSAATDRLDALIRRDRLGVDARYVAAVSSEAYERAFGAKLTGSTGMAALLSPDEAEAVQAVERAGLERALVVGDPPNAGYPVPATIDPTIALSSDGALSPLRELANVVTATSAEWRGVTSEGVTAAFAKEGTEVDDGTPTLAGPSIKPEKAHAFVPASIELTQDWTSLQVQLARLFADAKDVLEASKFLTGSGTDEPLGLLTGLLDIGSGSGDPDPLMYSAAGDTLALADVYALQEALGARWQPNATWLSSLGIANKVDQLSGGPGSDTPLLFDATGTRILRKPWREVSDMTSSVAGGSNVAVYGDIRSTYTIADRIGASVEVIQHLVGTHQRPTGERGFYMFWRVGGGVTVQNASRVLQIAAGGSGSGS